MAIEESTIARPYAEAVFQRAQETGKLKLWSEMLEFLAVIVEDPGMASVIVNPNFDKDTLKELILDVCGGRIESEASNFVKLLIDNGRLATLPSILKRFEHLKSEAGGEIDVVISSAYTLRATERNTIAKALSDRLGKEVNITTEKDPALIGGIRICAGDLVIDGSIQARLRQLATEFGI